MSNLQATEGINELVGQKQSTNHQYMPNACKKANAGQILYVVRAYFAHIYFASLDTLAWMLKAFVTYL